MLEAIAASDAGVANFSEENLPSLPEAAESTLHALLFKPSTRFSPHTLGQSISTFRIAYHTAMLCYSHGDAPSGTTSRTLASKVS